MSYDFATNQVCTHQVFFEQVGLDPDTHQSVQFPYPPTNISGISVYIDRVKIPSEGLYSYAELPFQHPEPYRIRKDVNDLIYFGIGNDPPQFLQLLSGPGVSAKDLARYLQKQFRNLFIDVQNQRIVIRSIHPTKGKAFQFYDPRWTDVTSSLISTSRVMGAYNTLGIVPGRASFGTKLFPGWRIEHVKGSPLDEDRQVTFEYPLPHHDPLIEVSYVTSPQNCRRCHGVNLEFDYRILNNTYETVNGVNLLAQEWDKFVITKVGSHWKWTWLGTGLLDRIGGKAQTGGISATSMITVDINQAFRIYQNIKQQQEQGFPQAKVTDEEYPSRLVSLSVNSLPDDPTVAIVNAVIANRSSQTIDNIRIVGNPNPLQLKSDSVSRLMLTSGFQFRG